jgi:hypothetical protein
MKLALVPAAGLALTLGACTLILGNDFEIVATGAGGGEAGGAGPGGGQPGECGNGVVEGSETCDDADTDVNDGCFNCQVEWTCEAPGEIDLMVVGAGYEGSIQGSTAQGSDQVASATCGEESAGAGTDRILAVALPEPLDLFVSLTPAFDGMVRLMSVPCDLGSGVGCVNTVAGAGTEVLHAPGLDAGTYYVLVDGATADDAGEFTLDVFACAPDRSDLVFKEVHVGQQDYALVYNTGACPVQLEGMRALFDDRDDLQPDAEDCLTELPAYLLLPGTSVRIHEYPLAGDIGALDGIVTGCSAGVPFNPGRGGTAYLCDGECEADTIIDMVSFRGSSGGAINDPPTPLAGVSFDTPLTALTTAEQNDSHWIRSGLAGSNPAFAGADWQKETRVLYESFDTDLSQWTITEGQEATLTLDTVAALGATSLTIQQTGGNGVSDMLVRPIAAAPRFVSLHVRTLATDTSAGYLEFDSGGLVPLVLSFEPTGYGLEIENGERIEQPLVAETWYHIELRDIDWEARVADLYVDSRVVALDVPFLANVFSITELNLYSVSGGSQVWIDEIELWQP